MASVDVIKACLDSISQISDQVADAVLYLDAGCLEAFQFFGAFPLLLELGALAICSLENMSSLDTVVDWNSSFMDPAKKMVVITSRLLSDAHRYILRCLSTHQTFLHCTIFTSISEIAHSAYVDSPLGPDAFREYESLLLQDYEELVRKSGIKKHSVVQPEKGEPQVRLLQDEEGWSQLASSEEGTSDPIVSSTVMDLHETNDSSPTEGWIRLNVSVCHFPMILCPLSPRVFVLPSEGAIAEAHLSNNHEDSLSPGLPPLNTGLLSDGEDIPPGATLTAHFLYHLIAKMDLKMEIFSLGDLSKIIGKIMTDMSSLYDVGGRNKRTAGLLLVDRTLDLITPCCHGDSLLDRIFSSLPRRERTLFANVKGSQTPNKVASALQRAPLDARIPLGKLLIDNESPTNGIQYFESFLSGWNSSHSGSQIADLSCPSSKLDGTAFMSSELGSLSGSFVCTENYEGAHYLEAILDRRTKDGGLLIRKWLQETIRKENMALNIRTRPGIVSASELHSMVKILSSNQASLLRNKGIIQLGIAAEVALSEPHISRWDAFISAERILTFSARDTSQSLCGQICDIINRSVPVRTHEHANNKEIPQGLLSLQDAITLAITGYILAGENFPTSGSNGPFSWEEEHSLKEAIVDAILEYPTGAKFRFLQGLEQELEAHRNNVDSEKPKETSSDQSTIDFDEQWGTWDDEDTENNKEEMYGDMQLRLELRDRLDHAFKIFHKISGPKQNSTFKEADLIMEDNLGSNTYSNRGFLYKLLTMVMGKHDIPGLEYHSSAVGRFFKSGFGRFGLGQAKPRLGDQNILLIFVVGGINTLEVREVQDAVSESGGPGTELLIGGTTLLTPDDMFDLLLGSCSFL